MEVVVDGKREGVDLEPDSTLESILGTIRQHASSRSRLVVSVALNGEPLTAERQRELGGKPPAPDVRIEITTAEIRKFARETVDSLKAHLTKLENGHERAAEAMVAGNYKDAMQLYNGCFQGWAFLMSVVRDLVHLLGGDLASVSSGAVNAESALRRVQEVLLQYKQAFDTKDVVRMGDLTQYELRPLLADWASMLDSLALRAGETSGPSS